jgi:hypothetical protein
MRWTQLQSGMGGLMAAGGLVLAGRGGPFGPCEREQIQVTMAASVRRGGITAQEQLLGAVAPGNLSGSGQYERLKSVLVEGGSSPGVILTVPAFDTSPGYIGLALGGSLSEGNRIPVSEIVAAGGWGAFDLPAGQRAEVNLVAGGFAASAVTGTIEVLQAAPLRLRLDLTVSNTAGETIGIAGDMRFEFIRERVPCT